MMKHEENLARVQDAPETEFRKKLQFYNESQAYGKKVDQLFADLAVSFYEIDVMLEKELNDDSLQNEDTLITGWKPQPETEVI